MKNLKESISKVKEENVRLMGLFLFIILITFITVILVYFLYLYKTNKDSVDIVPYTIKAILSDKEYELIDVDSIISLNEKCSEYCKFKTGSENYTYYEIRKEDTYILEVKSLYRFIERVDLGNSISELSIRKYNNNDLIKFIYSDSYNSYDEIIISNGYKLDKFTTLGTNELDITDDGIIYYSYSCIKGNGYNSLKFKNIRKPYEDVNTIISYENINLDIC